MKIYSLIILLFICKNVTAQRNGSPYIYDSTLDIGHIKLVEYPNSKLFFREYMQSIDTSEKHKNEYLSTIKFKVTGALVNRIFTLTFDHPVNFCELKCQNNVSQVTTIANKDKTVYKFAIKELKTAEFSFIIFSKEKVYTKISEVSKYITP